MTIYKEANIYIPLYLFGKQTLCYAQSLHSFLGAMLLYKPLCSLDTFTQICLQKSVEVVLKIIVEGLDQFKTSTLAISCHLNSVRFFFLFPLSFNLSS